MDTGLPSRTMRSPVFSAYADLYAVAIGWRGATGRASMRGHGIVNPAMPNCG
ncbi:hypothetical protein [Burkholderia cepacia]|uniref:hypothetical protein n=1 Tax=Burkholderia cepacia TaxID=292 RepID=UPI0018C61292|nr:hypothetical protein [Burkholderia cepacia]